MPVGLTHPTKDDILTLKANNGVFNLSLKGGVLIFGPLRPERRERHHRSGRGPDRSRPQSSRWLPRLPSLTYSCCPMEPPFSSRSFAGFGDSPSIVTRQRDNATATRPVYQRAAPTPLSLTRGAEGHHADSTQKRTPAQRAGRMCAAGRGRGACRLAQRWSIRGDRDAVIGARPHIPRHA